MRNIAYSRTYSKEYYSHHKGQKRETMREYYRKNQASLLEASLSWQRDNKERRVGINRRYYLNRKLIKVAPRCFSCESILKMGEEKVCGWCSKTYMV